MFKCVCVCVGGGGQDPGVQLVFIEGGGEYSSVHWPRAATFPPAYCSDTWTELRPDGRTTSALRHAPTSLAGTARDGVTVSNFSIARSL